MKVRPSGIKILKLEGQNIRLKKIEDSKFEGKHPTGINEGYIGEGICQNNLIVGECAYLIFESRYFRTSTITEIIDHNCVRTQNSIYEIQIV